MEVFVFGYPPPTATSSNPVISTNLWILKKVFSEKVTDAMLGRCDSRILAYVLCCRWRRWGGTATVWRSLQLVLRVRPTTSATIHTQNTSAGIGLPQRCLTSYLFVSSGTLYSMVVVVGSVSKLLITLSLSGCFPESELCWPVILQPGGAALSALLQSWPHTPQSQKQLPVTVQRCSCAHQVSFRYHHWKSDLERSSIISFSSFLMLICGFCYLGELQYGLGRKQLRTNYRWREDGRRATLTIRGLLSSYLTELLFLHKHTHSWSILRNVFFMRSAFDFPLEGCCYS